MAITIRNKRVEDGIRRLGRLRGEGPSAVVARLVDKELGGLGVGGPSGEDRAIRRRKALEEWLAGLPPVSEKDRREIDHVMDEMYDDNGLPR